MGCDIHPFFERKNDAGQWEALWLDMPWSYGKSPDEIDDEIGWHSPYEKYPLLQEDAGKYHYPEIKRRDYEFFGRIAGVRAFDLRLWRPHRIGPDLSREVTAHLLNELPDSHSHGWHMVSTLLNEPRLKPDKDVSPWVKDGEDFIQVQWLRRFIQEPERTRMVFWFDN